MGGTIRNPRTAAPGERYYTDQLVLAQTGLVAQEKGSPTQAHIWEATIFVDEATHWIKVCLMQDASGKHKIEVNDALREMLCPKEYLFDFIIQIMVAMQNICLRKIVRTNCNA